MIPHNSVITEHEVLEIRALIEQRSGIRFDGARQGLLSAGIREHVAARRLSQGADLVRNIRHSSSEFEALLERVLVHESSFFRYPDAFDALEKRVLPDLHMKKFWENPRSLRIWSAGCATGEEPYSIAITIADSLEISDCWNVSILAADISRQALQHAERGVYPLARLAALAPRQVETCFNRVGDQYMVKPRIRNLVSFVSMNLADAAYPGRFDCIFCMNVLGYFSEDRQAKLMRRFHDHLEPGGFLFLADGETITDAPVRFQCLTHGNARICQKPLGPASKLSESVHRQRRAQA